MQSFVTKFISNFSYHLRNYLQNKVCVRDGVNLVKTGYL